MGRRGGSGHTSGSGGNAAASSSSTANTLELDPSHRKFLSNSLGRCDTELAALGRLHVDLRVLRSIIVERYGEFALFPNEDCEKKGVCGTVENDCGGNLEKQHEKERAAQQLYPEKIVSSVLSSRLEEEKSGIDGKCNSRDKLLMEFRLRMKLRRRLLNRLSRRINRLAHIMDGDTGSALSPPANPKYGDARYHVDDAKIGEYWEDRRRRDGALAELRMRAAERIERNVGGAWVPRALAPDLHEEELQNRLIEYEVGYHEPAASGSMPSTIVESGDSTHCAAEIGDKRTDAPPGLESGIFSAGDVKDPPPQCAVSSTSAPSGTNATGKTQTPSPAQIPIPEYAAMKKGDGIGAQHKYMSAKERESEFLRWKADVLARVPDQPTFDELGMGLEKHVFNEEQRREKLREEEKEREGARLLIGDERANYEASKLKEDSEYETKGDLRLEGTVNTSDDEGHVNVREEDASRGEHSDADRRSYDDKSNAIEADDTDENDSSSTSSESGTKTETSENEDEDEDDEGVDEEEDEDLKLDDSASTEEKAGEASTSNMEDSDDEETDEEEENDNEDDDDDDDDDDDKERGEVEEGEVTEDDDSREDGEVREDADEDDSDDAVSMRNEGAGAQTQESVQSAGSLVSDEDVESGAEADADLKMSWKGKDEVVEDDNTKLKREGPKKEGEEAVERVKGAVSAKDEHKATKKLKSSASSEPKKKPRLSLHPVPSFGLQDARRIRAIHADLVYASVSEQVRKRLEDVSQEYNAALRQSTDLQNHKLRLQGELHKMMLAHRQSAAALAVQQPQRRLTKKRDYALDVAIARAKWQKSKEAWEADKASRSRRLQHLANHEAAAFARTGMIPTGIVRGMVSIVLANAVDAVVHRASKTKGVAPGPRRSAVRGYSPLMLDYLNEAHQTFEDFVPPQMEEDEDDKTKLKVVGGGQKEDKLLKRKREEAETAKRKEIHHVTGKFNASEEERKRVWRKMLKIKAEFDPKNVVSGAGKGGGGSGGASGTYVDVPPPMLSGSRKQYVPPPMPPYVPPGSSLGPGAAGGNAQPPPIPGAPTSTRKRGQGSRGGKGGGGGDGHGGTHGVGDKYEGKYSLAKVKERKFPDGSVMPVQMPKRNKDGLYQRPAGRRRKGMDWDAVRGRWIPTGDP